MATRKLLDARTWFTTSLDDDESQNTTALAPRDEEQGMEVVQGEPVTTIDVTAGLSAKREAARLRRKIEEFDEDRLGWGEWAVVKLFTFLAYVMPVATAWVVGLAIGDAFSGPFTFTSNWSVYAHVISVFFEMCLPMLGLSVTKSVKRAFKDRTQVWVAAILGVVFVALAVGNAFATIYLVETRVKIADNDLPGHIATWFRAFGPLVIDVSATIFLSIVTIKSLQKFLSDMQNKAQGVQMATHAVIEVDRAWAQSDIDKELAKNDLERKRMDQQLLVELTRRRNQETLGGGNKGRYGGSW